MAPHKTLFILFIVGVTSAVGLTISRLASSEDDPHSADGGDYIFADDYFQDKKAEGTAEKKDTLKNCEKVVKNGMVCLVCEEPENNEKYEQCAYVSHPRTKSFAYQNSQSEPDIDEIVNKPDDKKQQKKQKKPSRRHETEESEEYFINLPSKQARQLEKIDDDSNDEDRQDDSSGYVSESEKLSKNIEDDDCEEVEKDGMICKQCRSSKTGGKYEKCSSAYQPKEKVYKYSTSKSFGYPKSKSPKKEKSQSYRRADDKAYKPESEEADEKKSDSVNCETVVKDSMTCQVCLDPHTNENSEQCSYSYDPDDKVYAYSKSRSFGTPKKHRE